ncbi:MAG: hypothetical protein HY748_05900 [Elusimicrobia bacterium]|nr:hypothetical protein [Elusimicrobiota bacterium]
MTSAITFVGFAIAAVLTAVLLGRRKTLIALAAAACLGAVVTAGILTRRTYFKLLPEGKLQLTLQLARRQWHVGEAPWYLLQMKNVGGKQLKIFDAFWVDQRFLNENSSRKRLTRFEIINPDGKTLEPNFRLEWGYHNEFRFWANDCGGSPCEFKDRKEGVDVLKIEPGKTLTANPTIVAPLRKRGERWGLGDARIKPGATSEEISSIKKLWRLRGKYYQEFAGGKPYQLDPEKPLQTVAGFRVLEGYFFGKPGIYRMRAIYDTRSWFTPITEQEEVAQQRDEKRRELSASELGEISKKWRSMTPRDLRQRRNDRMEEQGHSKWNRAIIKDDDIFKEWFVESNPVEIEVVP